MYRYKRLFVGLDFSDKDTSLIAYTSLITRMAQSQEVIFCHVQQEEHLPLELRQEHPELHGETPEDLKILMQEKVDELFTGYNQTKVRCEVLQGHPIHEMLRFIKDQDIDLSIVGKHSEVDISSKIPEKLTRKAPCSVLILPQDSPAEITSILVPVEFSKTCALAMEAAVAFGRAAGLKEITCVHIYKLPLGYHKTGKTKEEFQEIMEKNARNAFDEFMTKIDLKGLTINPVFHLHQNAIKGVKEIIDSRAPDLVILGAQGRGAGAAILLGSVTEGLIRKEYIPILAVKRKGANMNLLESIMKL